MNKHQWKLLIYIMFISIGLNIAHPATPGLVEIKGFRSSIFGELFALMSFGFLLGTILWGTWSDKVQRKLLVTIPFGLLYGGGQFLMGFAPTEEFMLLARIVSGLGAAAFFTAAPSLISAYSDKNKAQAQTYSIVFTTAGMGFGYLLGGTLSELLNPNLTINVQVIFVVTVSVIGLLFLSKAENEKSSLKYLAQLKKGISGLKREHLIMMFIALMPFFAVRQTINKWIDVYAVSDKYVDGLHGSTIYLGIFVAVSGMCSLLFTLSIGRKIIKKYNDLKVAKVSIFICGALIVIGGWLISLSNSQWVLWTNIIIVIIATILWSTADGAMSAVITKKYNSEAGTVFGLQQFVKQVGSIAASMIAGIVLTSTNFSFLFIGFGLVMLFAWMLLLKQKNI